MKCPRCSCPKTQVLDSRNRSRFRRIRRRRCLTCEHEFSTTEIVGQVSAVDSPLLQPRVIKKDGNIESFQADKLLKSIVVSVRKPQRDTKKIQKIVENIEEKILNEPDNLVDTLSIGEMILKELMTYDIIAYIRYASIHQEMEDINDFKILIEKTLKNNASH